MNDIITIINSFLGKYLKDLTKDHKNEILKLIDELTSAINNNTIALTKLCEKIEREVH